MIRFVSAAETTVTLADSDEIAFLDVREIVPFGTGHPLLATNLPLSSLELSVGALLPRTGVRIVVTDGGEGHAELAAGRLERLGYRDVAVLEGGAQAWARAGEALFQEIEVPTKGFGGFAERFGHPAFITPPELDRALHSGENWVVLDSRPRAEYRKGNIPGSIDAPGADVVRCFDDLVPDPSTKVVVNCMSFTRGILGGLSLKAAEVPNEVYVLRHGTRGWLLDGLELETNANRFSGTPSVKALENAKKRAARIAERGGIAIIDSAEFALWRADADRTTYLFDVRTAEEYASGHIPGSRNAPEGSIVMGPDRYFATLNARIVLVDDDGVRATVTALWLAQMGWGEVVVLRDGLVGQALEAGPEPASTIDFGDGLTANISAENFAKRIKAEATRIIDVGPSDTYVHGCVPGALWCSRVVLGAYLRDNPHDGLTVLTSEDGALAHLAVNDLDAPLTDQLLVLAGGTSAWSKEGFELEYGAERLVSERDDHWLASSERPGDTRKNVVNYLEWEIALLDTIERGGPSPYRNLIWN